MNGIKFDFQTTIIEIALNLKIKPEIKAKLIEEFNSTYQEFEKVSKQSDTFHGSKYRVLEELSDLAQRIVLGDPKTSLLTKCEIMNFFANNGGSICLDKDSIFID